MKLLSTVAAGALLLAGCAPFEHGHYANDVDYINDVGDRPGTPVLVGAGYDDGYYEQPAIQSASYVRSEPAYAEPVYSSPAPIIEASYVEEVQQYAPPPVQVVHRKRPRFIEQAQYIEPQYIEPQYAEPQYIEPEYAEPRYIEPASTYEIAPMLTSLPAPKPVQYVSAPPPIVAATTVSVEEERYIGETRYAPPEVINAPPVFMRGPGQFSNQPFPDPAYPQYGPPAPGFGFPQQGYGFPQSRPGFGYGNPNPYGMPVAANTRPPFPGQGYGAPYGNNGCVTTCGGTPVF